MKSLFIYRANHSLRVPVTLYFKHKPMIFLLHHQKRPLPEDEVDSFGDGEEWWFLDKIMVNPQLGRVHLTLCAINPSTASKNKQKNPLMLKAD